MSPCMGLETMAVNTTLVGTSRIVWADTQDRHQPAQSANTPAMTSSPLAHNQPPILPNFPDVATTWEQPHYGGAHPGLPNPSLRVPPVTRTDLHSPRAPVLNRGGLRWMGHTHLALPMAPGCGMTKTTRIMGGARANHTLPFQPPGNHEPAPSPSSSSTTSIALLTCNDGAPCPGPKLTNQPTPTPPASIIYSPLPPPQPPPNSPHIQSTNNRVPHTQSTVNNVCFSPTICHTPSTVNKVPCMLLTAPTTSPHQDSPICCSLPSEEDVLGLEGNVLGFHITDFPPGLLSLECAGAVSPCAVANLGLHKDSWTNDIRAQLPDPAGI
jgi:hypothetical protein